MNISQIRARLSRAKEHVKADPWYVSTNVYITDVGELLEEVDRLTTAIGDLKEAVHTIIIPQMEECERERDATQKQLEAALELIGAIDNDDTGDFEFIQFKIKEWRGERSGENGNA